MPVSVSIDHINSVTDQHIIPKLAENFFYGDPLWVGMKGRRKAVPGGSDIRFPVQHSKSQAAKRWGGGATTFEAVLQDSITTAVCEAVRYIVSLAIPQEDMVKNMGGKEKILDLVKTQVELAENSLVHLMSTDLYLTGATSEDSGSQPGLYGLQHALTLGSNSANGAYLGISRTGASGTFASPTANAFWNACVAAANANGTVNFFSGATSWDNSTVLTTAKMQTMFGGCTNGRQKPSLILTSQTLFNKYHSLLTAIQQQMTDDRIGKAGFDTLQFNFKPVVASPFINAATSMYFLNEETFEYKPYSAMEFDADDFIRVPNARVYIKSIAWMGNIICKFPNRNGVITGLTAS